MEKTYNKKTMKTIILLILGMLLLTNVSALSISPSYVEINSSIGSSQNLNLTINSEQDSYVEIYSNNLNCIVENNSFEVYQGNNYINLSFYISADSDLVSKDCVFNVNFYNISSPEPKLAPISSGGSSGGSYSKISNVNIENGFTLTLGIGAVVSLKINNISHNLFVNSIREKEVIITIHSNPIRIVMREGEERKLNLSSQDYYDLYIKVDKIENKRATITIGRIYETILKENNAVFLNKTNEPVCVGDTCNANENDNSKVIIFFLVIGGLLILVIIGLRVHYSKKSNAPEIIA